MTQRQPFGDFLASGSASPAPGWRGRGGGRGRGGRGGSAPGRGNFHQPKKAFNADYSNVPFDYQNINERRYKKLEPSSVEPFGSTAPRNASTQDVANPHAPRIPKLPHAPGIATPNKVHGLGFHTPGNASQTGASVKRTPWDTSRGGKDGMWGGRGRAPLFVKAGELFKDGEVDVVTQDEDITIHVKQLPLSDPSAPQMVDFQGDVEMDIIPAGPGDGVVDADELERILFEHVEVMDEDHLAETAMTRITSPVEPKGLVPLDVEESSPSKYDICHVTKFAEQLSINAQDLILETEDLDQSHPANDGTLDTETSQIDVERDVERATAPVENHDTVLEEDHVPTTEFFIDTIPEPIHAGLRDQQSSEDIAPVAEPVAQQQQDEDLFFIDTDPTNESGAELPVQYDRVDIPALGSSRSPEAASDDEEIVFVPLKFKKPKPMAVNMTQTKQQSVRFQPDQHRFIHAPNQRPVSRADPPRPHQPSLLSRPIPSSAPAPEELPDLSRIYADGQAISRGKKAAKREKRRERKNGKRAIARLSLQRTPRDDSDIEWGSDGPPSGVGDDDLGAPGSNARFEDGEHEHEDILRDYVQGVKLGMMSDIMDGEDQEQLYALDDWVDNINSLSKKDKMSDDDYAVEHKGRGSTASRKNILKQKPRTESSQEHEGPKVIGNVKDENARWLTEEAEQRTEDRGWLEGVVEAEAADVVDESDDDDDGDESSGSSTGGWKELEETQRHGIFDGSNKWDERSSANGDDDVDDSDESEAGETLDFDQTAWFVNAMDDALNNDKFAINDSRLRKHIFKSIENGDFPDDFGTAPAPKSKHKKMKGVPMELQVQWEKDRSTKAEKKRERELARQLEELESSTLAGSSRKGKGKKSKAKANDKASKKIHDASVAHLIPGSAADVADMFSADEALTDEEEFFSRYDFLGDQDKIGVHLGSSKKNRWQSGGTSQPKSASQPNSFKKIGASSSGKKSLEWIDGLMQKLLNDKQTETISLPLMAKDERKKVHMLAECYGLGSKSRGTGKKKTINIYKTKRAGVNVKYGVRERLITASSHTGGQFYKLLHSKPGGSRPAGKDWATGPSAKAREGETVGFGADKIGTDNVGHKLLSMMGWTEGDRIGQGSGINVPIMAIVKNTKSGLGA